MMRILLKTNLILILILALVMCIMARPYITNELVRSKYLIKNEESTSIQYNNHEISTVYTVIITKAFVNELFNESGHMDQQVISEILHILSSGISLLGRLWFSLYLLTNMLSFSISFAYIKGWLIKVSQVAKARLGFLLLKSSVKNGSSYECHLTTYTI